MSVQDLKDHVSGCKVGDTLNIATSQYANNTTAPGFRFDFWSSAPAVRSLINAGYLKGENRWRYYEVTVVKLP